MEQGINYYEPSKFSQSKYCGYIRVWTVSLRISVELFFSQNQRRINKSYTLILFLLSFNIWRSKDVKRQRIVDTNGSQLKVELYSFWNAANSENDE